MQISETETPLHRLETVYRRLNERLSTADAPHGALRSIVDGWFYTLEQDVVSGAKASQAHDVIAQRTATLMEQRLADVTRTTPALASALRVPSGAAEGDTPTADGSSPGSRTTQRRRSVKRAAAIKGDIDHFGH